MLDWYNRDGDKITTEEVNRLLGDNEYKIVKQTQVGSYFVSTVWLGLDHNYLSDGPPIIFETMVFATSPNVEGLGPDLDSRRYSTEAQALEGHEEMVLIVTATNIDVPEAVVEEVKSDE
jgi:hypothetical protein